MQGKARHPKWCLFFLFSFFRDPKVYLLRRKMDKRRKRATRFYSQSIHRPNPTPCATAVRLMQTRIQPSCDVTLHVAALAGQELVPRRKWDSSVLSC